MNFSMHLIVVVAAAYLCRADAAPDERLAREAQRPTRTFKPGFMAARGFGKRNLQNTRVEQQDDSSYCRPVRRTFEPKSTMLTAFGFGKRAENVGKERDLDKFWTRLDSYQREGLENDEGTDEPQSSSIPSEWFIREMMNNPDFARAVVMKFIDLNQDGMLSTEELLRNVKV